MDFDLEELFKNPEKTRKVPVTPSFLEPVAYPAVIDAVTALQKADVVFTGSISLYLHGKLRPDRRILDIDIVVRSIGEVPQLVKKVPLLGYKIREDDTHKKYKESHLVQLTYNGNVKVDCFIVNDIEESAYQGVTGIRCIYQAKIDIVLNLAEKRGPNWEKHSLDLLYLLLPKGGIEYNRCLLNKYS